MRDKKQNIDELLRQTDAPVFQNPEHQQQLREELLASFDAQVAAEEKPEEKTGWTLFSPSLATMTNLGIASILIIVASGIGLNKLLDTSEPKEFHDAYYAVKKSNKAKTDASKIALGETLGDSKQQLDDKIAFDYKQTAPAITPKKTDRDLRLTSRDSTIALSKKNKSIVALGGTAIANDSEQKKSYNGNIQDQPAESIKLQINDGFINEAIANKSGEEKKDLAQLRREKTTNEHLAMRLREKKTAPKPIRAEPDFAPQSSVSNFTDLEEESGLFGAITNGRGGRSNSKTGKAPELDFDSDNKELAATADSRATIAKQEKTPSQRASTRALQPAFKKETEKLAEAIPRTKNTLAHKLPAKGAQIESSPTDTHGFRGIQSGAVKKTEASEEVTKESTDGLTTLTWGAIAAEGETGEGLVDDESRTLTRKTQDDDFFGAFQKKDSILATVATPRYAGQFLFQDVEQQTLASGLKIEITNTAGVPLERFDITETRESKSEIIGKDDISAKTIDAIKVDQIFAYVTSKETEKYGLARQQQVRFSLAPAPWNDSNGLLWYEGISTESKNSQDPTAWFDSSQITRYRSFGTYWSREFEPEKKKRNLKEKPRDQFIALYEIEPQSVQNGKNIAGRKVTSRLTFNRLGNTQIEGAQNKPESGSLRQWDFRLALGTEKQTESARQYTTINAAPKEFQLATAVAAYGLMITNSPQKGDLTWDKVLQLTQNAVGKKPVGREKEFLQLVKQQRQKALKK